jgi:hypothetical protein
MPQELLIITDYGLRSDELKQYLDEKFPLEMDQVKVTVSRAEVGQVATRTKRIIPTQHTPPTFCLTTPRKLEPVS